MKKLGLLLARYLAALDKVGKWATILGLLPGVVDFIARLWGYTLPIPAWGHALWFVAAFSIANLRLFAKLASSDVEFRVKNTRAYLRAIAFGRFRDHAPHRASNTTAQMRKTSLERLNSSA